MDKLIEQIEKHRDKWQKKWSKSTQLRDSDFEHYDQFLHGESVGATRAYNNVLQWMKGPSIMSSEKDLGWHSVDESLPPMDEEVIVLLGEWNEVSIEPLYRIAFGHVVNKEYCEDFNGWNIPGVRYWMPMPEIPKEGMK